jgi:chromosome condensin MukBEF ATPase and DNA-binding subunit MukB
MSDIIDLVLAGAAGYAVSELSKSHPLKEAVDNRLNRNKANKDLRDIIREYAKARGIYTQDNRLAKELHDIATEYQEYDYDRYY